MHLSIDLLDRHIVFHHSRLQLSTLTPYIVSDGSEGSIEALQKTDDLRVCSVHPTI